MQQYVSWFIKESIFIDVLHLVDEKVLSDMGISTVGDRMRILAACNELKQKREGRSLSPSTSSPMASAYNMRPTASPSQLTPIAAASSNSSTILSTNTSAQSDPRRPTRQRPMRKQIPNIPTPLPPDSIKNNLSNITTSFIQYNQLEFTEQLGAGASGQVYKGFYQDMEVAIKVFETKFQEFEHEFKIIR